MVGLGAGGHAKVIIEILQDDKTYELIGLLDRDIKLHGQKVLGVSVLGDDDLLPTLKKDGITHFFVGVGSIGDTSPRRQLFERAIAYKMEPVDIIHDQAIISPSADLGLGVTIMAGAIINTCVTLGTNVVVNTGAIIEHDCIIGNHVHIATGSKLASTVYVGDGTHIGLGTSIRQCVNIGQNVIIGAGAVVVNDIPDNITVVGVPARPI